jgi:hypothetical protein
MSADRFVAHIPLHGGPLDGVLARVGERVTAAGYIRVPASQGHYAADPDSPGRWAWRQGEPVGYEATS